MSATDLIVARIDTARVALADAVTPREVNAVVAIAAAAKVYAQRQHLSQQCIDYAFELELDATHKLGLILVDTPKNEGGRPNKTGTSAEPVSGSPTLADLGIDKKTSSRAQKIATLADDVLLAVKKRKKKLGQAFRELLAQKIKTEVSAPTAKYRVIYADPPGVPP